MKNSHFLSPAILIFIIANIAVSCSSINEPSEQLLNEAAEAQNGTSINTLNVTIYVKDNYDGKYLYKIEIFENDPTASNVKAAKTGYGSKDIWYKTNMQLSKQTNIVYIKQTDPLNNQLIKSIEIPTDGTEIICNFN